MKQKTLKEKIQIFETILEHTHIMAVLLDADFNFIWVNRAYADTCGKDTSFFQGKNHFGLYPHEENRAIFKKVVDTGEPFFITAKPFEFPDQPERGVTYWDWSLQPIKALGGQLERYSTWFLPCPRSLIGSWQERHLKKANGNTVNLYRMPAALSYAGE